MKLLNWVFACSNRMGDVVVVVRVSCILTAAAVLRQIAKATFCRLSGNIDHQISLEMVVLPLACMTACLLKFLKSDLWRGPDGLSTVNTGVRR
jgi:hypothetical protein